MNFNIFKWFKREPLVLPEWKWVGRVNAHWVDEDEEKTHIHYDLFIDENSDKRKYKGYGRLTELHPIRRVCESWKDGTPDALIYKCLGEKLPSYWKDCEYLKENIPDKSPPSKPNFKLIKFDKKDEVPVPDN